MRAGFAGIDITPAVGSTLNGFIARMSPSIGVDLPLYVRALVMETETCRVLMVGLDVLGLSPHFADRLVDRLARAIGIPAEHVVLASSHTHSGPMTAPLRGLGAADESYLHWLESRVCEAAALAAMNVRPVSVSWGAAPVEIGVNRRQILEGQRTAVLGTNPDGPSDRLVRVLHLQSDRRSCILFEHACHPYCLGTEHPLISPDFWGYAAKVLLDAGHDSIYLNGCAGDIAPVMAFQGTEAARKTGARLAEAVVQACCAAEKESDPSLLAGSAHIHLPFDALPSWAEIEAALREPDRTVRDSEGANPAIKSRLQAAWQEWLGDLKRAESKAGALGGVAGRISIVRVGRGAVVALPGEVFYGIGERIANRLKGEPFCMAAYGHGYIGYVPDAAAFAYGGYEVDEAHRYIGLWRVGPQSESLLQGSVMELWRRLGGELR